MNSEYNTIADVLKIQVSASLNRYFLYRIMTDGDKLELVHIHKADVYKTDEKTPLVGSTESQIVSSDTHEDVGKLCCSCDLVVL